MDNGKDEAVSKAIGLKMESGKWKMGRMKEVAGIRQFEEDKVL